MIRTDLKAASSEELHAALEAAGVQPLVLDEIGTLSRATDAIGAEGLPVTEALAGWHANLYTADALSDDQAAALAGLILPTPATPMRMLMGEQLE